MILPWLIQDNTKTVLNKWSCIERLDSLLQCLQRMTDLVTCKMHEDSSARYSLNPNISAESVD